MKDPSSEVALWLSGLPADATSEVVRDGFWYVRIPGVKRRWIPFEIELGSRTLKVTSHVLPAPIDNEAAVYRFLLRHNAAADGCHFAFDGTEAVITLVARLDEVTVESLDAAVGSIITRTEETFRSILELGFASLLRK